MNEYEVRLFKTIFAFSEQFCITPPQSLNIAKWWRDALQEMDKESVYIIYETFLEPKGEIIQQMKEDLIARKIELDKLCS